GPHTLTLRVEDLAPATLFSPDTGVALLSAIARPPTDRDGARRRAAGQRLAFVRRREDGRSDTVRATVVRASPPQYRLSDGRFVLSEPGEPMFPAELVRTAPEVSVVLEASRSRERTDLAYVLQGATWEALYQIVLGGGGASVTGTATVT